MNPQQRLQSWTTQWTTQSLLTGLELTDIPSPVMAPSTRDHSVSSGGGLAAKIMSQVRASITPDDAQKAELTQAYQVSARSGKRKPTPPLFPGQVRQLNPELRASWERSVIVIVLQVDAEAERALVAPFSGFAQPAFDGELATELPDASLAVLCLWNVAWVPLAVLHRSWWLTDAPQSLLSEGKALLIAREGHLELPEFIADRVGPPIRNLFDARHDYIDAEAGLLLGLDEEAA